MTQLPSRLAAAARARDAQDWATARRLYGEALAATPGSAEITLELAVCALATADASEALRLAATVTDPAFVGRAALLRGKICQLAGHIDVAAGEYERGLADPQTPPDMRRPAAMALAELTLNQFGDPARAEGILQTLQESSPDKAAEATLIADMYLGRYRGAALAERFIAHAQRHIAAPEARPRTDPTASPRATRKPRARPARRRTLIGVLSPSLFATPVGFLTLGAFESLAAQADLVFFDRRPRKDWVSEGLRATAKSWHDVSKLGYQALANELREAELDAVIDCGGWTDVSALTALSLRPCPRQFKWVGGQALTTGLDCFDGFLTDERQVPKSSEGSYIEPIKRFSTSYVTYVPPPYFDYVAGQQQAQASLPKAREQVYALVSNPAKIGPETIEFVKSLRPKKLWLVDTRWRHARTRAHLLPALTETADTVEYLTPTGHREYLETLRDLPATFIDTRPYNMGLTAIELLLLGKPIVGPPRRPGGLMYERHSFGHERATRFDHYDTQAAELLQWCRS